MMGAKLSTLFTILMISTMLGGCAVVQQVQAPAAAPVNAADPAADPAAAGQQKLDGLPGTTLVSMMPEQGEDPQATADPATGAEATNPPAPDGDPQAPGPRSDLEAPRGTITRTAEIQELKDRYGITLGGNYSDTEIQMAITAARQYRPTETRKCTMNFFIGKGNEMGAGGMYSEDPALETPGADGLIEMYDSSFHCTLHELTHHIHFYPENANTGKKNAEAVTNAIPGYPKSFQLRFVPSEYALTEKGEFWAEFYSYLRKFEKNLDDGEPYLKAFDPTEDVRVVARQGFAD